MNATHVAKTPRPNSTRTGTKRADCTSLAGWSKHARPISCDMGRDAVIGMSGCFGGLRARHERRAARGRGG